MDRQLCQELKTANKEYNKQFLSNKCFENFELFLVGICANYRDYTCKISKEDFIASSAKILIS